MKKFIAVIAVGAMFASCKKDYTCECTGGNVPAGAATIEYKKVKKKDATESCDKLTTAYAIYGTGVKCAIK